MTYQRVPVIFCTLLTLCVLSESARADLTIVNHNQTTLEEELIADGLTASETSDRATRQFQIQNDTGVTWTDYHFRVSSDTDPIVIFNKELSVQAGNLHSSFATVEFSPDMTEVWFLDGTVQNSEALNVTLILWDDGDQNNLGPADVFGTSSVPEPSTFALGALGLLGIGYRRRK
jgi:hypothetical protein